MLSSLTKTWLAYARSVFDCDAHLQQCDAPIIAGIDPTLRWPGFIGSRYESAPKRLLLVGRVHNPSGWPSLIRLEGLAKDWVSGVTSDEDFFQSYNREYARQLVTWGPWQKVYSHLAAAAGTDENGIAYVNVAKCWQHPGRESARQRRCSRSFPLEALAQIVEPKGVFILATSQWVAQNPGAYVTSAPLMCDSAPHFQIPYQRLAAAQDWVRSLR
jgi:hypothetical protein